MNRFLRTNFNSALLILFTFFANPMAFAQTNQLGTLTVDMSNLKNNDGQVLVQLYRKIDPLRL
jgi:uncharacterized protein (DUF2141 family)